ncbi:integration host factor subunit beta [Thiohalorhabdus denitrificans]|uniref:Integration host factor subunit beta n=1 Tax=Thiohalorhabdus denitrificans TaxID=381306 RepID=A0A0P9CU14_9GAMM|nr:integration host factor subunit beta [Thiohalorhabdus denitrificans]KPV40158.1 integration host factor subunit beta [Thiohalorhabdus denitrificans]SCY18095.1 integration host factor subunit beta [Thiohalorhabdus denitrificans]
MTKSDLIDRVCERLDYLTRKDAEVAVNTLFDYLSEQIAADRRIELRGFGSFGTKSRAARRGRNPKTGETVDVPPKRVPFFRAGKSLREEVDQG